MEFYQDPSYYPDVTLEKGSRLTRGVSRLVELCRPPHIFGSSSNDLFKRLFTLVVDVTRDRVIP